MAAAFGLSMPCQVQARLAELFAAVPAFEFELINVRWFDQTVLWLAPDTDGRFRRLTDMVERQWPAYPPYGGQFDDAVPHLTIADRAPAEDMRTAAREVLPTLPIQARALAVTLMTERADGRWRRAQTFPLTPVSSGQDVHTDKT